MRKNTSGFTLVELLIVIVVIAILAGTSVVAYNGITNRAYSSKFATAIASYDKYFKLAAAENGRYIEAPVSGSKACLGRASDYPATARFPAGACIVDTANPSNNVFFSSSLVSEVEAMLSSMPEVPVGYETQYETSTEYYRGAYVDITSSYYEIQAALPNKISCPSNMREYDLGDNMHWCELGGYIPAS